MLLKILSAVVLCAAAGMLAFAVRSAVRGYRLVKETGHPKRAAPAEMRNIPWRTRCFHFSSGDGLPLAAIQYFPRGEAKGTIIACHYLGGSKTSVYSYIEPLLKAGYTIAAFDYPNHGGSGDRRGIRYSLEDDMKRFVCRIREIGLPEPYGTIGFSMGATIAFSAADNLPELRAVVVDSGPMIFVRDYFRYVLNNKQVRNPLERSVFLFLYLHVVGFSRMQKRTVERLKRMRALPTMLIHSKTDRIIPYRDAVYAHSLLNPETAELITVEKAHHLTNRVVMGETYDALVVGFFDRWMSGEEAANPNMP